MKKYRYLIVTSIILLFFITTMYYWKYVYTYIQDPNSFVVYLKSINIYKATLIFVLLNYLQVILTFIPGGPFEMVAGLMYGEVLGILICDVVMTLGSLSVYLLVKKYGRKVIELFIDYQKIEELKFLNNKKLKYILFIIFLIPGTPKDAISYAVGLTKLKVKDWLIICFIGRLPAIVLTILGTNSFVKSKYEITVIVLVIFLVLYLIGLRVYKKLNVKDKTNDKND